MWAGNISRITRHLRIGEILDYGCGKGTLRTKIKSYDSRLKVKEYDPMLDKNEVEPSRLVACISVLECVEPNLLDNVLKHLKSMTKQCIFFGISTTLSKHTLADGRNVRLTHKPLEWWVEKLAEYFNIVEYHKMAFGIFAIADKPGKHKPYERGFYGI